MDANHTSGEENSAADDIAAEITKILVKAFTAKEGRAPTAEEVEQLTEELTEERIESMLGGLGDDDEESAVNSDESEPEDEGEPEVVEKEVVVQGVTAPVSPSVSGTKRSLDEEVQKNTITSDENVDFNEVKKQKAVIDGTDAL